MVVLRRSPVGGAKEVATRNWRRRLKLTGEKKGTALIFVDFLLQVVGVEYGVSLLIFHGNLKVWVVGVERLLWNFVSSLTLKSNVDTLISLELGGALCVSVIKLEDTSSVKDLKLAVKKEVNEIEQSTMGHRQICCLTDFITGAINIFKRMNVGTLDLGDFLAIGPIFSATDSVCTLQVLNQDETPLLYSLVFGEGVVNDATSVVIFNAVQNFDLSRISTSEAFNLIGNFFYLFFTSTILGAGAGLLSAYVIKRLYFGRHSTDREVAIMILMPYLSYMLAELSYLSGILTVFFCGIVMSHYTCHNVTEKSRGTTKHSAGDLYGLVKWKFHKSLVGILTQSMLGDQVHNELQDGDQNQIDSQAGDPIRIELQDGDQNRSELQAGNQIGVGLQDGDQIGIGLQAGEQIGIGLQDTDQNGIGLLDREADINTMNVEEHEKEEGVKELTVNSEADGLKSQEALSENKVLGGNMVASRLNMKLVTKIFIHGLVQGTKEEDIRKFFEEVGEIVEVKIISNLKTGKNRGFGFIRFASADHANLVVFSLDVSVLQKERGYLGQGF